MPDTPEQKARKRIDAQLVAAGWQVQDRRHLNLHAAPGVALCETDVEGGFADYMLYDEEKARGYIQNFEQFLAENQDRLIALQILYNRPHAKRHLTYDLIRALALFGKDRLPTLLEELNTALAA